MKVLWTVLFLCCAAKALFAQRILSLAPSLTETTCAIGQCEKLVGVTNFCVYPPEVSFLPKVGGYLDPNLELVVALQPDLVLVLPEHRDTSARLKTLGLRVEELRNYSLNDIYTSMEKIGRFCGEGASRLAKQKVAELKARAASYVRTRVKPPRCLLVLGHEPGTRELKEVYVVGRQGFLNDLLQMVGGENAYERANPYYPKLSQEALLSIDPDYILDLVPQASLTAAEREARLKLWRSVTNLRAIREGRYRLVLGTSVLQAGPRFIDTMRDLGAAIGQP